jgi:hypothetical protein
MVLQAQVIPEPGSLIGDLLSMDIGGAGAPPPGPPAPLADLLGGGLDQLLGGPVPDTTQGKHIYRSSGTQCNGSGMIRIQI